MRFAARYYDGIKAEPYDVQVYVGLDSLLIKIPEVENSFEWKYTNVEIPAKPEYDRPLIISNNTASNSRIIIQDNNLYDFLIKKIPKNNAPLISISASYKSLMLWLVPTIAIVIGIYFSADQLVAPIARNFPISWEKSIGEYAADVITGNSAVCNNPEGIKALNKMVGILASHLENKPVITAKVIQEKDINAVAVPYYQIIIFSKLIETSSNPDELAGVIAHEMGHVIRRHPIQSLVRVIGMNLLIYMAFGGAGDTSTTASIGNGLLQLRYNRDFEREADETAIQTLYNAGIDNKGFVNFFVRLQAEGKMTHENILSYISTHPATSERIAAVQKAKNITKAKQILTSEEWKALKNICL